jgi:hypothetical protein
MDRLSNVAPLHGRRHQRSKILCAVACSLVGDGEEWFEPRPFVLCVDAPSVAGPIIEGLAAVGLNRRDKVDSNHSGKALREGPGIGERAE